MRSSAASEKLSLGLQITLVLLYVTGSKLIAITGDRSAGRILWQWQGPANLSLPAIADLDGDGLAQIIIQAADGSVHCVGSQP